MIQKAPASITHDLPSLLALEDFGILQSRYQSLPLSDRARAVLKDAKPAIDMIEKILGELDHHSKSKEIFAELRANPALIGKMRSSEAKNILLDGSNDFIASTRHKINAWQKTMDRIGHGEGVTRENNQEYISSTVSVAMALISVNALDAYLAVIQLALVQLVNIDKKNAEHHKSSIVKVRRCATLLSDYDNASSLRAVIH